MSEALPTLAVIGGSGSLGSGLALRWARAGYRVIIGSRDAAKAKAAAAEHSARLGHADIEGTSNSAAAAAAEIVVVAVPFAAQAETLAGIRAAVQGKIVVDVTVPLQPPRVARVQLPAGGSAAAIAGQILGDKVRLVSAFQNVAAHHLADPDHAIDCDVLVCGDDEAARETVIALARAAGLTAYHAGPLANAAASEALTSVLIGINRRYKVDGAGIRLTGIDRAGN